MKPRTLEIFSIVFAWIAGLILVSAVLVLLGYLFIKGYTCLNLSLIFGDTPPLRALLFRARVFDGLFPAIAGTLVLVILSIVLAIPIGISTGIYLAEYAGSRIKRALDAFFDVLSGIPSIVIGLFGFSFAVFLHKQYSNRIGPCLLISSIALSLLVLPYIIRTTQAALEGIPSNIRMTALALGATRLQNVFLVLIPRSLSGIMSGIILAIGRCAEDTAVIMLTGAVASAGVPRSVFAQFEALPFYIYYISSQYSDPEELMRGYGASIILLLLCALLFAVAYGIRKGLSHFVFYRP
ncbi:phosphate ABC transporter permease PstA [Syntrophotalea acetylenica]|uniref:Phosphate transport system permease protein PstA n=1 Tax=Syntrophotalea acetylenica TaxID=29542 RepID=A0A1L3GEF1_SYNAC|nr:phosphate ABC transporter permease PstA [Syntrophotalea acetylenica]APG24330.1 phosphate ABC transporter, permease protein PstA [Syntrophotalea acetylenica]APG44912.1 phosphate ABC transporter permease [Syntrophotalea acetylenica]